MQEIVNISLNKLIQYCESVNYMGYDPYDTLNAKCKIIKSKSSIAGITTQIQKRNPINIRPFLGINKEINPKGMGLFLKSYCLLYRKTGELKFMEKADSIFKWLSDNCSKGYSGYTWGYNFDWASSVNYLKAYTPSVVVTSFIIDGVHEYFKVTGNAEARKIISSSSVFVKEDIPVTKLKDGISFSYTPFSKGCCYNASLLACEILAKADKINDTSDNRALINNAIDLIISKQKPEGEWAYSINPETDYERKQIDFHQGFILMSLFRLNGLMDPPRKDVDEVIKKGLFFYRNKQFLETGQALWRIPRKWPVDIHNQSQGIITFSKLKKYNPEYLLFAKKIAVWTIKNMQSETGYFYYRKNPIFVNKISYIRWAQAWMMLALSELGSNE